MDILFWLNERTRFIRGFYQTAHRPFAETIARGQSASTPVGAAGPLGFDESSAYIEWAEAKDALDVLGLVCGTMLANSLKVYFRAWEKELRIEVPDKQRKRIFARGYLKGYQIVFEDRLGSRWSKCPADLDLIEQIILARNRDQHPDDITRIIPKHSQRDVERFGAPRLVDAFGRAYVEDFADIPNLTPAVSISANLIGSAISAVEVLARWMDEELRTTNPVGMG